MKDLSSCVPELAWAHIGDKQAHMSAALQYAVYGSPAGLDRRSGTHKEGKACLCYNMTYELRDLIHKDGLYCLQWAGKDASDDTGVLILVPIAVGMLSVY